MIRSGLAARGLTQWTTIVLALVSGAAVAQEKSCILLKTAGEIAQVVPDAVDGIHRKAAHLVPADRIVPGETVIYTVSATNICEQPAERVLIDVPVPEHMTYVAGSAIGPDTEVSFSVDGGFVYGKPEELKIAAAEGTERKAVPKDYTHIRWTMRGPLEPGAVAFIRFRAIFE